MTKTTSKISHLLLFALLAASLPLLAEDKKAAVAPELTPSELRQVERFSDLYGELGQQLAEAQARLKVIQDMQQKLMAEYNNFQSSVIEARGYKAGQAVMDLQQRKVTAIPAKPDAPAAPTANATPTANPSK
jgi:hypothetical protein